MSVPNQPPDPAKGPAPGPDLGESGTAATEESWSDLVGLPGAPGQGTRPGEPSRRARAARRGGQAPEEPPGGTAPEPQTGQHPRPWWARPEGGQRSWQQVFESRQSPRHPANPPVEAMEPPPASAPPRTRPARPPAPPLPPSVLTPATLQSPTPSPTAAPAPRPASPPPPPPVPAPLPAPPPVRPVQERPPQPAAPLPAFPAPLPARSEPPRPPAPEPPSPPRRLVLPETEARVLDLTDQRRGQPAPERPAVSAAPATAETHLLRRDPGFGPAPDAGPPDGADPDVWPVPRPAPRAPRVPPPGFPVPPAAGAALEPAVGHLGLADGPPHAVVDGQRPDPATETLPSRRARRMGDPPVAAGSGRSGRNLPVAIGVGAVLGALGLIALLTRKEVFVALASVAIVLAVWEICIAFGAKRVTVPVIPLAVGALGMLVSAYVAGEEGLLVSFTLTAFGMLLWRIIDGVEGAVRDVAASVFAAAYVPFLAGFALLMLAQPDGRYRVLAFLAVCAASDIGGYALGSLAGRHPMAPTISPKKSWEGLIGSVLACLVVAVPMVTLLLAGPWWAGALLGVAMALTATLGDLAESLLKRDLGIKDMGWMLPGHGGVMDRLDSLLISAPVAYLLLTWLVAGT